MEQVPDDFLECWATCFWAAHIRAQVSVGGHLLSEDARVERLTKLVYQLTALRKDEMMGETVLKTISAMNDRFVPRLGLNRTQVDETHTKASQEWGT